MAVTGIAGIGHQDLVARVDIERSYAEQPAGRARRDRYPRSRNFTSKFTSIVAGDRVTERIETQRGGVGSATVPDGAHARFHHRRGRGEVGLADLHVHHVTAGALERLRARQHVHHLEGLDFGGAPRRTHGSL